MSTIAISFKNLTLAGIRTGEAKRNFFPEIGQKLRFRKVDSRHELETNP
jgi:hypothetical protein